MAQMNSYQLAVAAFHSAIDFEQMNKNEDAYKKYAEGLSLISTNLKTELSSLNQPNVYNLHKRLLEFAQKSVERLVKLLEKFEQESKSDTNNQEQFAYRNLSHFLPEVMTNKPVVPVTFRDELPEFLSPLSALEDDKRRIIRCYESRIDALMNSTAKANLRLELERRLAENDSLAKSRFEQWENKRKALAGECQQIAHQKFNIQEKINSGVVNDSDFTKKGLYAVCLQYHKEHPWAQEASCKIYSSLDDENYIRKIIGFILQHKSHPLACMLRQVQQKVTNKLSKLNLNQTTISINEKIILDEHLKNITQDIKEDLFILTTVIQTIWEPLANEKNHLLIVDILHNLYFPSVKPNLIQLFRISLHDQEQNLQKCSEKNALHVAQYPQCFNSIINKIHQLPPMHSPTTMMVFLVETLKTFVNLSCAKDPNDRSVSLAIGIDDIMPKLIELVLISNLPFLPAEIAFVESFMPAKNALGEEGYAVTLMQSILTYIYNNRNSLNTLA